MMPREFDARHTHKGVYSAWLTKVKSNVGKVRWIQSSSVKRYFTIDFDSQIVFYSHSEADKRISLPITFRDILSASMISSPPRTPGAEQADHQVMRRSMSGSWLTGRQDAGESPFVLQTRDRRIRLVADNEADAYSWVEMLNAAHRIGKGEAPARTFSPRSMPSSCTAAEMRSTQTTPTTMESRSTTEGSEATASRSSSPTALSDVEVASHAERPRPPPLPEGWESSWSDKYSRYYYFHREKGLSVWTVPAEAASVSAKQPCKEISEQEVAPCQAVASQATAATDDNMPSAELEPTAQSHSRSRPSWQTSGSLQVADFGFDDRDVKEASSSRASSPDSVTISLHPRAGSPISGARGSGDCSQISTHKDCPSDDHEDDDSDCEVACEVRDRRKEQDLELVKRQQQKPRPVRQKPPSPCSSRGSKECHSKIDSGGADDAEKAARIAADLRLLQKPGGAGFAAVAAANAPAPLRQRAQVDADANVDEEKVRRRAERKAAKMLAAQTANDASCTCMEEPASDQISAEEAKARRRAARKAAKEAAAKEQQEVPRHRQTDETVGVAVKDAWAHGAEVVSCM